MKTLDRKTCIDIGNRCINYSIRKASRSINQLYDMCLKPSGLRITQFSLLNAIKIYEPVNITKLAKVSMLERTTLTRNLRNLEKLNLIVATSGDDKRMHLLALSNKGNTVLAETYTYWQMAQDMIQKKAGFELIGRLMKDMGEIVSLVKNK